MGRETVLTPPSNPKDSTTLQYKQPSTSPPVDPLSSPCNKRETPTSIGASRVMFSSALVGEFMMSLGAQENINIQQEPMVTPGAISAGPLNDEGDFVDHDISETVNAPIVAHLAPDEADIEARITERVQNRINQVLQERLTETLVVSESVVVANEIKDDTIPESNKWSTWIIVTLVLWVVGSIVRCVAFWLLRDKGGRSRDTSGSILRSLRSEITGQSHGGTETHHCSSRGGLLPVNLSLHFQARRNQTVLSRPDMCLLFRR